MSPSVEVSFGLYPWIITLTGRAFDHGLEFPRVPEKTVSYIYQNHEISGHLEHFIRLKFVIDSDIDLMKLTCLKFTF